MWNDKGRSGYGDTNLDGTYDDVILGVSPNGRQYRNEATLETRNLSGAAYWNLRKQNTPEQEIPEALYARNETESMSHTLANGRANLAKYADPIVVRKATSKVNIKDKILPQKRRVDSLTAQMIELESEYKAGKMSIQDYSLYRDIVSAKRDRAIVLLDRAMKVKPIRSETDGDSAQDSLEYTPSSGFSPQPNDGYASEEYEAVGVRFIDELSNENSLKGVLKFSCKAIRKVVQFSHKARAYWQELKEV